MESSYSNLDNTDVLGPADIVWLDHCYVGLDRIQVNNLSIKKEAETKVPKNDSKRFEIPSRDDTEQSVNDAVDGFLQTKPSNRLPEIVSEKTTDQEIGSSSSKVHSYQIGSSNLNKASPVKPPQLAMRKTKHILRSSYFTRESGPLECIDIVNANEPAEIENSVFQHDGEKVRSSLTELERSIRFLRKADPGANWNNNVEKSDWSSMQTNLFKKVSAILFDDHLKRLVYRGDPKYHILVLNIIRQSSQFLRDVYAGFCFWDTELIDWLHITLCKYLSNQFLVMYLQLLQNLKLDIPSLIDGMIDRCKGKVGSLTPDFWVCLNRKLVDPITTAPAVVTNKLSGNPLILVIPDIGSLGSGSDRNSNRRYKYFLSQMSSLGKATAVNILTSDDVSTPANYLSILVSTLKMKLSEIRELQSNRTVILVGFGIGSLVAAIVAASHKVSSLVCIGVSLRSMEGTYTYVEDFFAQLSCPVLFVVGEMSKFCSIDDLEDLRQNMSAEGSAVIVVSGCNDNLTISERKSFEQKVTQSMVDKYICSEISNYLSSLLTDESLSKITLGNLAWSSANKIKESKMMEKLSNEHVETTPANPLTPVKSKSRTLSRSSKTELQQQQLDSESNTAANLLEDLLESGQSSVPFAKATGSRDTSPTGSTVAKRQKMSGLIPSDDSDSGDSYVSSSFNECMNISRNPVGVGGTHRFYAQIRSKQGFFPVGLSKKTFDQKQVRNTQVQLDKSRKKPKEHLNKPKKQKFVDVLAYSENIASGSI